MADGLSQEESPHASIQRLYDTINSLSLTVRNYALDRLSRDNEESLGPFYRQATRMIVAATREVHTLEDWHKRRELEPEAETSTIKVWDLVYHPGLAMVGVVRKTGEGDLPPYTIHWLGGGRATVRINERSALLRIGPYPIDKAQLRA